MPARHAERPLVSRSTMLFLAAVGLCAIAIAAPALADGGESGTGSAGGTNSSSAAGGDGVTGTAGGGGGAGATGGNGGDGNGGTGGLGGASPGANGGDGNNGGSTGAGGGGGGAHGYVGATAPTVSATGGNGGQGGNSPMGAGGGGAGGYGAVVTWSLANETFSGSFTGGNGGNGGSTAGVGSGGSGGIGLMLSYTDAVTIAGTVLGGDGGDGRLSGTGGAGGTGLALTASGGNVLVNGTISGGDGGGGPNLGAGGVGLTGSSTAFNLTVGSEGTISGGTGLGGQANAITFAGTANVLTLHSGATINGKVSGGSVALTLGGTTDGTFDLGTIGTQFLSVGAFRKVDSSTWTATGSSTLGGTARVFGGTLVMNGSMANSGFLISSGAALKGTGTTGNVSLASGATHAPGNSIGTQTVGGNYTLLSGAILQIEANAAGQSDKVIVGGTVSLTGAILDVIAAAGSYAASTEYLIIDKQSAGAVTGTFGQINSNLAFLTPTVAYDGGDGNDVVLTLVNTAPVDFCKVATTGNECNVGNAVQNLGPGNPLYDAILVQTVQGAQQGFNALSGGVHSTISSTLANDSHYVRDILLSRLVQAYYARTGGATQTAALGAGGPTTVAGLNGAPMMGLGMSGLGMGTGGGADQHLAVVSPLNFWAQGYGAWADFDGNGNAAGASRTLGGFMSGMDAMFHDSWRIGAAIGYARTDVSVGDGRFSSADVDSYQIAAYTSGAVSSLVVRGGIVWSWSDISTTRSVVFPGFFDRTEASYSGNTGQVFGEVALPLAHGDIAYERGIL